MSTSSNNEIISRDAYISLREECASMKEDLMHDAKRHMTYKEYKEYLWENTEDSHYPCVVELYQHDFNDGTVRLRHGDGIGMVFKLMEDITFHPNGSNNEAKEEEVERPKTVTRPLIDFEPKEDSDEYPMPPYQLGFFAAITIEISNMVLDLNGHKIQQSEAHALQQRFYAHIEIGNSPFIKGQGPANFGDLYGHKNIVIRNGILGRSSHHGIHGNGFSNILIEDLQVRDFEVGGIHLNGMSNCLIQRCSVGPSRRDVPVISTYSQAKVILKKLNLILARDPEAALEFSKGEKLPGNRIKQLLSDNLREVHRLAIKEKRGVNWCHTDDLRARLGFFKNEDGLSDCSVYGIVLNKLGVAVAGLRTKANPDYRINGNENNVLADITIHGLHCKPIEVVGLSNPKKAIMSQSRGESGEKQKLFHTAPSVKRRFRYGGAGAIQTGPFGDVFPALELADVYGRFKPTALALSQLFIAMNGQGPRERGTTNLHSAVLHWALSGSSNLGEYSLQKAMQENQIYFVHGADSMAHAQKGLIGLFLQNAKDLHVINISLSNLRQAGLPGGNHNNEDQNTVLFPSSTQPGYQGVTLRAICVASCENVHLIGVDLSDSKSDFGNVIGCDVIGQSKNVFQVGCSIQRAECAKESSGGANPDPVCIGISVGKQD